MCVLVCIYTHSVYVCVCKDYHHAVSVACVCVCVRVCARHAVVYLFCMS